MKKPTDVITELWLHYRPYYLRHSESKGEDTEAIRHVTEHCLVEMSELESLGPHEDGDEEIARTSAINASVDVLLSMVQEGSAAPDEILAIAVCPRCGRLEQCLSWVFKDLPNGNRKWLRGCSLCRGYIPEA